MLKTEIKCYFLEDSLERRLRNVLENEWEVRLLWLMVVPTCGVAILVKSGGGGLQDCTIHSKMLDPFGRYFRQKAKINDKMHVLINVYAPNKDRNIVTFLRFDLSGKITLMKEKTLSDSRSIWNRLKNNIRAHTIRHPKRRAQDRNEREQKLQEKYAKAMNIFETDPNDRNANISEIFLILLIILWNWSLMRVRP